MQTSYKEDSRCNTSRILSIFFTTTILFLFLKAIAATADFPIDSNMIRALFPVGAREFVSPEPLENRLFLFGVLFAPFCLATSYTIIRRLLRNVNDNSAAFLFSISSSFMVLATGFLAWKGMKECNFFYFKNTFFPHLTPMTFLCSASVALSLLLGRESSNPPWKIVQLLGTLPHLAVFFVIIAFPLYGIFSINAVRDHYIFTDSFNAVFHAVAQVFNGKAILIDFPHQYGLYPHFLEPLFRITGLTVLTFTLVMTIFSVLSLFLLYTVLLKMVRFRIIASLGFLALLYYNIVFGRIEMPEIYFQYHPIRTLFPAIAIYLAWLYLQSESTALYYFTFTLASIAVLWNFDTGFIVFSSWLLMLLFHELTQRNMRGMLRHIFIGCAILTGIVSAFTGYMFIRYGHLPEFHLFFLSQKIFYQFGLNMLPMPLIHPWNLVILTYLAGLVYSLSSLCDRERSVKATMVFFLSVLGTGIFSYYQGRSHNLCLLAVSYPAIMLVTIFADTLTTRIRRYATIPERITLASILFFMLFAIGGFTTALPTYFRDTMSRILPTVAQEKTFVTRNAEFIRKHTAGKKEAVILSLHSGLYHLNSETSSPIYNPGPSELVLTEHYIQLNNYLLQNRDILVFLDYISDYNSKFSTYGITEIITRNYKLLEFSPDHNMAVYKRLTGQGT